MPVRLHHVSCVPWRPGPDASLTDGSNEGCGLSRRGASYSGMDPVTLSSLHISRVAACPGQQDPVLHSPEDLERKLNSEFRSWLSEAVLFFFFR